MRVSLGWLRELLQDPSLEAPLVAERLTAAGLEVEAVQTFGAGVEPVLVVAVTGIRPHPHRSGLRLVTVDLGARTLEIVCGAPNVPDPGGLVVLAPIGTTLPAIGVRLTARDIGGVVSEGMLCSERELGIGFPGAGKSEDDGILVLPAGFAEPGTLLVAALPAAMDTVFEIGVTPNRPDALGHLGVARELATLLGRSFAPPPRAASARGAGAERSDALVKVTIADDARERCPEYAGHVVVDTKIGPSPLAVRYRLHALGVRAISNAVDVTNLVMMLHGHPLHAFDLDRLDGQAIHVRRARAGEQVVTLDGETRTLVDDDLVICDGGANGGKPVALAGVMGAGNSEIGADTRRVLLECAYFEPRSVRRTARRHGLHSESSHRFERGVDPGGVAAVLAHATDLLAELCGGAALEGPVGVQVTAPVRARIALRHARLEALLGVTVPEAEAAEILERLGCARDGEEAGAAVWLAPTHRPDLHREVDLIEEVARVRGLDCIPAVLPTVPPQAPRLTGAIDRRARLLGAELGLSEAISYGFASPRDLAAVGAPAATVHLQNPLGEERGVMRTSLLPGLFSALRRARQYGEARVRLFEVGARFLASVEPGVPCDEVPSFAAVLAGPRRGWPGDEGDADVWDGKGLAIELVERLTGQRATVRPLGDARPSFLHPRAAAEVCVGDARVGVFGVLHPDVVDAFELDRAPAASAAKAPVVLEVDLRAIEALGPRARPRFSALPSLPAVTRDVALEVDEAVTAGALAEALFGGAGPLCVGVEPFDVYRGKGVVDGRKSVALRVTYRDPAGARTLTDAEVDERQKQAVAATTALGATARG